MEKMKILLIDEVFEKGRGPDKQKRKKRIGVRSPWTGNPKSVKDLHAVELSDVIRRKEERYGIKPADMRGWSRDKMENYFEEMKKALEIPGKEGKSGEGINLEKAYKKEHNTEKMEILSIDEALEKGRGPDKTPRKRRSGFGGSLQSHVNEGIRAIKEDGLSVNEVEEKVYEHFDEDIADKIMAKVKSAVGKSICGVVDLEKAYEDLDKGRGPDKKPRKRRRKMLHYVDSRDLKEGDTVHFDIPKGGLARTVEGKVKKIEMSTEDFGVRVPIVTFEHEGELHRIINPGKVKKRVSTTKKEREALLTPKQKQEVAKEMEKLKDPKYGRPTGRVAFTSERKPHWT